MILELLNSTKTEALGLLLLLVLAEIQIYRQRKKVNTLSKDIDALAEIIGTDRAMARKIKKKGSYNA